MRKQLWFHLVIVAVLLTACSQAATSNPGGTTPAAAVQPTNVPVATQDPNATAMTCTVVSANPTPGSTEASMFPSISGEDWVLGDNPNATMTIIEYSDFM